MKKAAEGAQKRYKEIAGRESKVDFEGELNDESAGGVIGSSMGGKIRVDNTLEERLHILEEKVSGVECGGIGGAHDRCCPS